MIATYLQRGWFILSTCWLLFVLEPLSSTGLSFPFFVLTFGVTLLFGVVSLVLGLTGRSLTRFWIVAWLVYPLAASSLVLLFISSQSPTNPLFRLRFYLSQPSLETVVLIPPTRMSPAKRIWAGLFPIRRIDVFESEVQLISDGCGIVDECGLLYRRGPIPDRRYKTRLKHLGGPWYHLYSVF